MKAFETQIDTWINSHQMEAARLLEELARIPAPSGKEYRRGEFCRRWLLTKGAGQVLVDEAGNIIFPYGIQPGDQNIMLMAHMDVVFQEEEELPVVQEGSIWKAPGIGDDTANLVNLLMTAAFFIEQQPVTSCGIFFVADTCEEGLGNLKGVRQLMKDYGCRLREVISFDLYQGQLFTDAVGSVRYEVSVRTEGGHSFSDFGRDNAIWICAELIHVLYQQQIPETARTTYNVGMIQGGTSVNTIAQEASFLYEFRSVDRECLEQMENNFALIMDNYRQRFDGIEVSCVGTRPCSYITDRETQENLCRQAKAVLERCLEGPVEEQSASTDCNVPLSMGIPAVTIGTVKGAGAHTREEWIDISSMPMGMKVVMLMASRYVMGDEQR